LRTVLFAILVSFSLVATAQERATAWQGSTPAGTTVQFDPQHLQRPAILFFWATWCPYCKALMPRIQSIHADAGQASVDVYAIDIQDDGDPVATLKERGATFTLVLDGDAIARQYGIQGTPGIVFVAKDGTVAYRRVSGSEPDVVEARLRALLGLDAAPANAPRPVPSGPGPMRRASLPTR